MIISNQNKLTLAAVTEFAAGKAAVSLSSDPVFIKKIEQNHEFIARRWQAGHDVYGATTGFGSSSHRRLDASQSTRLQVNLFRYHGCGVGKALPEATCAAVGLIRLNCLAQGASGVSLELLHHLEMLLQRRIIPVIPEQGSVGASGDLTPLSYLAAVMAGERNCYFQGVVRPVGEVYKELGLAPYQFKPREALAIMNGTSAMTAIAVLALREARLLADISCALTALLVELLAGRTAPFLEEAHVLKPHPGQVRAAEKIRALLHAPYKRLDYTPEKKRTIQDAYSLRCSPQVIGVLYDALTYGEEILRREVNAVTDNPLILDEKELVLNAGHFFGGHIANACDAIKAAVACVVNLLDRQLALLMEQKEYPYLTSNLVAVKTLGAEAPLHHGFKAMQITLSALASEIAKQAMPVSVFSRPTEAANQDVVSLGTTAARDLTHMLNMAADGAAVMAMSLRQGFAVAHEQGFSPPLNADAAQFLQHLTDVFPTVIEDRPLDGEIGLVRRKIFEVYGIESNGSN